MTAEELKSLLGKYASTEQMAMNGIMIGGVKYMFLSATDRVVRAKKGTSGVHCIKTVQGRSESDSPSLLPWAMGIHFKIIKSPRIWANLVHHVLPHFQNKGIILLAERVGLGNILNKALNILICTCKQPWADWVLLTNPDISRQWGITDQKY